MPTLITNTTKSPTPRIPFETIANDILGKTYALSLSFIGAKRAQSLNQTHRNKDYVPNVLSFPLDSTIGEIYICPIVAKAEAQNFSMTPRTYTIFLFIHGCLHLKGLDHGSKMESREKTYLKKYTTKN